jgi:hypothetical protein
MSASALGDINPYMGKGELLTGDQSMDWIIKHRNPRLIKRVSVPPGEDGTVLQADSKTNTGLTWAFPREPLATSLGNSVNLIVEFLKPLVQERIAKESERLGGTGTLKLFIRPISGDTVFTVPYNPEGTVQSLIDHLNKTYLVSLMNENRQFNLTCNKQILEPQRMLADYHDIQNEATLNITYQSAGKSKTRKSIKKSKGCRIRTLRK